jgi:putative membrane protein
MKHLLNETEFADLLTRQNKPNLLLHTQGMRIKEGMRMEMLGAFDNISMEPNLATFNNWQGACERIKNTPLPMNYQYFTKLFLYVFIFILPFCLAGDFFRMNIGFLVIPVSFIISFMFAVMNRVGEINENPFENQIQDIPMTALCNTIERDLKEMLGEKELPEKTLVQNGFLY